LCDRWHFCKAQGTWIRWFTCYFFPLMFQIYFISCCFCFFNSITRSLKFVWHQLNLRALKNFTETNMVWSHPVDERKNWERDHCYSWCTR
jgi:hypothetical protein